MPQPIYKPISPLPLFQSTLQINLPPPPYFFSSVSPVTLNAERPLASGSGANSPSVRVRVGILKCE